MFGFSFRSERVFSEWMIFFFLVFFFGSSRASRLYLSRRVNENCFCVRISKSKATKSSKILTENY